jgi:acetyl esterase
VLYLHSGGWIFGSVEAEQVAAVMVALEVGAVAVSVEYRLAPEDPYPAGGLVPQPGRAPCPA